MGGICIDMHRMDKIIEIHGMVEGCAQNIADALCAITRSGLGRCVSAWCQLDELERSSEEARWAVRVLTRTMQANVDT